MPKPSKSSASAGTRKKHAKKAGGGKDGDGAEAGPSQPHRRQRGEKGDKKLSKAQKRAMPKIKQYIPPPKPPAPPIPDPLDGQGLARELPAELVVVLRRLGKKDEVTRRKGLEELRDGWVSEVLKQAEGEDAELDKEMKETALLSAVPVWLHNLASLLQSPFHRSLAIQLHAELLSVPSIHTAIADSLSLGLLPGTQNRDVLGSWLVAALEEGRRSGGSGLRSWEACTTWRDPASAEEESGSSSGRIDLNAQIPSLIEYLTLSILDPQSLYEDIHPAPVAQKPAPPPTSKSQGKGGKNKAPPPYVASPAPEPPAEDEALVVERRARYRTGGFVGLSWLVRQLPQRGHATPPAELLELLRNPFLWTGLSSIEPTDGSTVIGAGQPPTRQAAYSLLESFVDAYPEEVSKAETLEILASAVLDVCWSEKEAIVWQQAGAAVAKFLSKNRSCWDLAAKASTRDDQAEAGNGGDDDDEEDADADETADNTADNTADEDEDADATQGEAAASSGPSTTPASLKQFDDFLQFVATICPSLPHLTYPLLLVIVSTLSDSLLPLADEPSQRLQTLFSHLWSPVDARLLSTHSLPNQPSAFQAFFQNVVEVTVFLVGKATRADRGEATANWLVTEQLGQRAWVDGVIALGGRAGRRRGQMDGQEQEAGVFGKALARIGNLSPELLGRALPVVRDNCVQACFAVRGEGSAVTMAVEPAVVLRRTPGVTQAVRESAGDGPVAEMLDELVGEVAARCTRALGVAESGAEVDIATCSSVLTSILATQSGTVRHDTREALASTLAAGLPDLLSQLKPQPVTQLLAAVIPVISSSEATAVRHAIAGIIDSRAIDEAARYAFAKELLAALSDASLLETGSLDSIAEEATLAALHSDHSPAAEVAVSCVTRHELSQDALHTILALVCTSIHDEIFNLLTGEDPSQRQRVGSAALEVFAAYALDHGAEIVRSDICLQAVVAIHHLVILNDVIAAKNPVPAFAISMWEQVRHLPQEEQAMVAAKVIESLKHLIGDTSCRVAPSDLVDAALLHPIGNLTPPPASTLAKNLLPASSDLVSALAAYTRKAPATTLAVVDLLISPVADGGGFAVSNEDFDSTGRSGAARTIEAASAILRADRQLAQVEPDLLRALLSASILASDAIAVPGASRGLYGSFVPTTHLSDFAREVEGALSYALAAIDDVQSSWHADAVTQIKKGQVDDKADFLQRLLVSVAQDVVPDGTADVPARVFRDVLARHLRQSGAGQKEAEVWLNFGMSLADRNPSMALAVIMAVCSLLLDTKPFETAQNRLANAVTTISAKQANAKGVPALKILIASAPPADAASVFLPQQRAIFVLRHVGGWLTSDEADDFGEEMEVRVAQLYIALAPIVQDLSGAHWDAISDLIESGLESSSLSEPSTYPLLYQCLLLLQQVRDLCSTNKSLRATWTARDAQLGLVLNLFLQCRDANSLPLRLIQELILDLLADVPPTAIESAPLPQLASLIRLSTSSAIQCAAYRILSRVIRTRTLALVLEVEASVSDVQDDETEMPAKTIELPMEIVGIAAEGMQVDWHSDLGVHTVLGQLLSWMAIIDHFDDASRTIRWAYLDQLNSTRLLSDSLMPMLFAILGVSEVGAWNFPANTYAVDEFYPDLLDPDTLPDLAPLASHLFYRTLVTLPSAMRTYYESIKDRQLSMSMLTFTARHYSPTIIEHEFSALREPSAMALLTEEGLNVRIAQGGGSTVAGTTGSAEAIASYVVDEQPMEIGIRLPAEFPLRGVDVRDLRRVGVPENKWRGWLMSVQQTITSRNGLILEALTVFKKNVSLHFDGVVECAICYSIISLTDRTLPTKPCKTCKNRFHASCLFKWFNSSHSSSCPLCRALF